MKFSINALFLISLFSCQHTLSRKDNPKKSKSRKLKKEVYLNEWAVVVIGDEEMADKVAKDTGFINKGKVYDDVYEFMHGGVPKRRKRASLVKSVHLQSDKRVVFAQQQESKERVKRSIYFNDTKWKSQWYLVSRLGFPAGIYLLKVNNGNKTLREICSELKTNTPEKEPNFEGHDLNVMPAWKKGYTGKGVVVAVVDDGLEHTHPEIQPNYDARASYDYNSNDTDPSPKINWREDNKHGTRCAGEIAAVANNSFCVVGVAFNARIGGIRMLDGEITDLVEAQSLRHARDYIDIYSISWGPKDDGKTVDGPGPLTQIALEEGSKFGRNGKGSIVVWASGNGGSKDHCNCDGYTNSIYTISVSAVTSTGHVPWYLESCASTLVSAYSSGDVLNERSIVTADLGDGCTDRHTGTSAAQPLVSGFIALALEANPALTWRDIQHLLVESANLDKLVAVDYPQNGAGKKFSHHFGYGILDGGKFVSNAEKWPTVPEQHKCYHTKGIERYPFNRFNKSHPLEIEIMTSACKGTPQYIRYVEHVQVKTSFFHYRRGASEIRIQSPMGTSSWVLRERLFDRDGGQFQKWVFLSTHFWGENPAGKWKVTFYSTENDPVKQGFLQDMTLIIYGTEHKPGVNNKDASYRDFECHKECIKGCTGPSNSQCSDCENFFYIHDDKKYCVANCPMQMYRKENSRECLPCHENCLTCTGANETDCLACKPVLTLNVGQCLKKCPKRMYRDRDPYVKGSSVCRICNKRCTECYGKADNCSACGAGFVLKDNKCVAKCRSHQWLDGDKCELCHPSCKTCQGGASSFNCTSCPKIYLNDVEDRFLVKDGQCLTSCPLGAYKDNTINQNCLDCPPNCLQCSNNGRKCEICDASNFRVASGDGKCAQECPEGYYTDYVKRLCEPCDLQCSKCVPGKPSACISCMNGFYLKDHECVSSSECQTRYYVNKTTGRCDFCPSTCSFCESREYCTTCFLNYYLTPDNKCVEKCPKGTYALDRRTTCGKCSPSCIECDGPTSYDCIACKKGEYLYKGRCISDVPDGYYAESHGESSICKQCHHTCKTCTGPTRKECLDCIEPLDQRENECINPCPGQYLSENNCQNCHPSCGSCFGPNGDHCLKCSGNFSLNTESHTCNKACPRKFYQDPKTFTCKPCHYSCASCFGPTPSQCLTCPEKLQFHNNTCVWHCPYGWYKTFGQECAPCSPRCKKCLYKYDLCTNCHQNDVWHDFKCFKKCGENMFHDSSNRCYPCHESCKTCNGTAPNECLTCPDGSTLHNNMCIEGCLSGHYYSTKKEMCLPCKKDCLKCKESEDSTIHCLICSHTTVLTSEGVCESKCPSGTRRNPLINQCVKCPGEGCDTCNKMQCLTCMNMYEISNKICKSTCPRRTFPDSKLKKCRPCHKSCLSCNGPTEHDCHRCTDAALTWMNDNKKISCLENCPPGFYKDSSSCKSCNKRCSTCISETECSACNKNYYLFNEACMSKCPENYVADESRICLNCEELINGCTECINKTTCSSCKSSFFKKNGNCFKICEEGTASTKTDCINCSQIYPSCSKCSEEECISCEKDFLKINNSCVQKCKDGNIILNGTCVGVLQTPSPETNTTSSPTTIINRKTSIVSKEQETSTTTPALTTSNVTPTVQHQTNLNMTKTGLPQTKLTATNGTGETKSIATTNILVSQSEDIFETTSEKTYTPVTEASTTLSSSTTKTEKEPYTTTASLVERFKAEILEVFKPIFNNTLQEKVIDVSSIDDNNKRRSKRNIEDTFGERKMSGSNEKPHFTVMGVAVAAFCAVAMLLLSTVIWRSRNILTNRLTRRHPLKLSFEIKDQSIYLH